MDNLPEQVDFRIHAPHPIQECQQLLKAQEKEGFFSMQQIRVAMESETSDRVRLQMRSRIGRNFHVNLEGIMQAVGSQTTRIEGTVAPDWWIKWILGVYTVVLLILILIAVQGISFVWLVILIYPVNMGYIVMQVRRHKRKLIDLVRATLNGEEEHS